MRESDSVFIPVRGLNYHCRTWGDPANPRLFLLHGFQDVSASWQFTADALTPNWYVVAPDWRGYGLSDPSGQDTYWYPDLVADLDVILDHFEPDIPARLVGHSMGGNTAALYAGAIPGHCEVRERRRLGRPLSLVDEAPRRCAKWLQQLARRDQQRPYIDFQDLPTRISENPRLTPERACFWCGIGAKGRKRFFVRRADPAHMHVKPTMWRVDEAMACWRKITAPVMWIEGSESRFVNSMRGEIDGYEDRLNAFQTLADLVQVDGAGHNVHHDQPEELAAAIDRFM